MAATGAVEVQEGDGPFLVLVDHASNRLPERYGTLGLRPQDLARHIAWDPGALPVALGLARLSGSAVVAGGVSRLVLDVNRLPGEPGSIATLSEATRVPGNEGVDETERRRRVEEVYTPFHTAAEEALARRRRDGLPTAVVGLHSFTPVYRGVARPWHVGVVFDQDDRLARALLDRLRAEPGLIVGANEPYGPTDRVYHSVGRHGEGNGLPCAMVEIRNDLIREVGEQLHWAALLDRALRDALHALPPPPSKGPPSCPATSP